MKLLAAAEFVLDIVAVTIMGGLCAGVILAGLGWLQEHLP